MNYWDLIKIKSCTAKKEHRMIGWVNEKKKKAIYLPPPKTQFRFKNIHKLTMKRWGNKVEPKTPIRDHYTYFRENRL